MAISIAIWIMYFVSIYFGVFWFIVFLQNDLKDVKAKKKVKGLPQVTIAVPVYNEEKSIIETLRSILGLNYPRNKLQLIIVDDCSTDSTSKIVNGFIETEGKHLGGVDLKYIKHEVNRGKGYALNTALKYTKDEFFICMDADSFIEQNALNNMLPYFDDPTVASVLPLIKLKKIKGFTLSLQYVEYLVNFFLKKLLSFLDCIHVTPGPFGAYRKSALDEVKGFDVNNLTEDLEMALRLQKKNYRIIQLMGTKVFTLGPENLKSWYMQRNRWYKGTLLNLFKYKGMMFNKEYGEFGMFQLPMVLGAAMLSIFFALFVVWSHMLKPFLQKAYDMSYIDFNVGLMTNLWIERFSFLDINYMLIFFTFVVMLLGLCWVILAFKYTEEFFTKRGFTSTTMYMIIYPFFLSVIWLGVVFDLLRGKKQKW
jgi:peptidoglycan-N-acetylglucosamine deacetylase